MFSKTVVCLLIIAFLVSFIMATHSGLLRKMLVKKLCLMEFNQTYCHQKARFSDAVIFASNKITRGTDHWLRIFNVSSLALSIVTILALSCVATTIAKKEYLGLYVAIVLSTQSLVYLILSAFKSAEIGHFFAGAMLTMLVGGDQGAVLFVWIFMAALTEKDLTRSIVFVCVEGMVYIGMAAGHFSTRYLPQHFPSISYLFAGTFLFSLVAYMLVSFVLPTFEDVIAWRHGLHARQYYLDKTAGLFYSLQHPLTTFKQEYMAGIILTAFLTQLGNALFSSVIVQYLLDPPLHLSYESTSHYLYSLTAIKGFSCIITVLLLTRIMFASDNTMVLISLSCSAFWMALIAYMNSETMLYVLTVCLGGFLPLTLSLLRCIASKEVGVLTGHFLLVISLVGSLGMLSQALLTYNSHVFIIADRKIFQPFTLILAGALQLLAFIVLASISCTFNKPLVEMPEQLQEFEMSKKQQLGEKSSESEPLLE